jgi:uncharacterized protein
MNKIIENNRKEIFELCKKHHVKKLFAFGSVMRDDFTEKSDIDFLYEFDTSGIDFDNLDSSEYDYADNFFSLKESLETLLHRKVDLLSYKEIRNRFLRKSIDEDKQLIYSDERFEEISR